MTFLELCQQLRQETGAAGRGPAGVSGQSGEYARLIGWVRAAWREIQLERRRWRFAWAEDSVEVETGFRDYPLPQDLDDWDEETVRLDGDKLCVLPWEDFRERFHDPVGKVQYAAILPYGRLRLNAHPEQAGVITFEYWRTPQELVEGDDKPRMPSRYHLAIVYRAMLQYGLYENAPEVVQQARVNYQEILSAMEVAELPEMTLEVDWV